MYTLIFGYVTYKIVEILVVRGAVSFGEPKLPEMMAQLYFGVNAISLGSVEV